MNCEGVLEEVVDVGARPTSADGVYEDGVYRIPEHSG